MEKVERKQNRDKRPHRLLWTLFCAVLLFLSVFGMFCLEEKKKTDTVPDRKETGGSIEKRETEEIARMTIQTKGRESWTAERSEDGKLRLQGSADWTLDKTLGSRIEDALANIVYEAVLSDDPEEYKDHLTEFGLQEPELIATVEYTDGKTVTLRFGQASELSDQNFHYMTLDGDHRLFAVATSLFDDLHVEAELLRPVNQPEIQSARLNRITILNEDGTIRGEWRLEGDIYDRDAGENWYLTSPVYYPADSDTISGLKKNAENIRLGIWVAEATEKNLEVYGLSSPSAVIELHQAAGITGSLSENGEYNVEEMEESLLRFEIGAERNEMTNYIRWGNDIYTINRFTLETLTKANPLETLSRYLVMVSPEELSSLIVETKNANTEYSLLRESSNSDKEDDSTESKVTIHCLKNGNEIPYSSFEATYERWMVMTVSGKLPQDWKKQETEKTCIFRSVSGKEHILEFSPLDALHDAVTIDGCTFFYVIRESMMELP